MQQHTFTFTDPQHIPIHVYCWSPDDERSIRGIVQIAHGMTETAERYERFAQALTDAGYVVYGNDHRGHGKTAAQVENLGYLGENGFEWMVLNMAQLSTMIKEKHEGLPLFLFGHSMGSFLSQQYISLHADLIEGVILCATNGPRGVDIIAGANLAKLIRTMRGDRHRSLLIDKLAFGSFNRKFEPSRTPFDWLSRDPAEVDKYVADPYCGFLSTVSFYHDFFRFLRVIHQPTTMARIPKTLPVMLIAGDADPVGMYGKGVLRLAEMYKQLTIQDVTCNIYAGARHELLNETNRDEITTDCIQWLRAHTK
ncbi:alpha/beta hydrolase [Paenibacillus sp. 481]|uniref:alpha/beta hydrolase n=1 Tax=Paenibacillus sp. 481 TaxID=2835869 RepID=UPI001E5EB1F5|nr:alpha/beta hydrolase [Paenibacillus sp. 481]UHA75952.1 lysophospholipase [Paenibacillus sp. 481]